MSTFLRLLGFEMRFYLKRVSTHVYFLIFFGMAFLFSGIACGVIPTPAGAAVALGGQIHVNSPEVIRGLMGGLGIFGLMITAAICGNAIYRDYEARIHPLLFTTRLTKATYLGGRFIGSVLVNAWIFASIPLGLLLPTLLPGADPHKIGPFQLAAYVQPFLLVLLPNLVFAGAIFFALASVTRQMLPNYLGSVALLMGYLIATALVSDVSHRTLAALLDPFGQIALEQVSRYWTPAEKNTLLLPSWGILTANRLIWLGASAVVFGACYARFRFSHLATEKAGRRVIEPEGAGLEPGQALVLPQVARSFGASGRLAQFLSVVRSSVRSVVANVYFAAIAGAGFIVLIFLATQIGKIYSTPLWPVTYHVLEVLGGTYRLFVIIIITFFAGELTWQERDLNANQVHDSLPMPTWAKYLGKLFALGVVVCLLQALMVVAGVLTQATHHYFRFELPLYFKVLFGTDLAFYASWCVLALFMHALLNNKYVAHLVFVLTFFLTGFVATLGFEHFLYRFGRSPRAVYSDMNGFGPFVPSMLAFVAYWAAVALVLVVATNVLWVRGQETSLKGRLAQARERSGRGTVAVGALGVLLTLATGGWIFYNTNVLNHYRTGKTLLKQQADYERNYRKYLKVPQPRITSVDIAVDLHPRAQSADFRGTYQMVNKNAVPVEDLHVLMPPFVKVDKMEFDPPAKSTLEDEVIGYRIYHLEQPLLPGASLTCRFEVAVRPRGFANDGPPTSIVDNGTFINSGVLPSFGYAENAEIADDDARRKQDLPPRERMHSIDDADARRNTYISQDADWVGFKATISTDPDQIALAPGYLQKEWTDKGRRYFAYEMDSPILNFYSFLSARYAVKKDTWNGVNLEIYYQPGHEWNLEAMMKGMKQALDYYTREFGPYQHRQVRILEFPRYAQFAQSFPNTIPYSEEIGFIMRRDDAANVDYAFYVTAHEVAHQWFAHQVIGADCQGSTMLSESLSQYSALMVMEHEYGADHMRRFLERELDSYLIGRATERKKELPLVLNENQQYIHYNKASVVFYALKEYLGEEKLNGVIRDYLAKVKFQDPPYTVSTELYDAIRAAAPPELQGFVDDELAKITLWDLETREAKASKRADGKWDVTLTCSARKFHADEKGAETEIPLAEPIEIGVYAKKALLDRGDAKRLYLERTAVESGVHDVTVVVDSEPGEAGIDPRHVLVDRRSGDNIKSVKIETETTPGR